MGIIILLIALGILLFLIEFLLIPGITVAGIGGALLTLAGIYVAFSNFGQQTGLIVLLGTLVITTVIFAISLRARTWRKAMLTTKIDSKMNEMPDENRIKPGDRGIAITRLAPMGTVRVNDLVFEVKSISGYVNPNTEIEIVKVSPSQILVKPIN